MSDLVIDASVAVLALIGTTDDAQAVRERIFTAIGHAPHLVDAEVGSVVRRKERAGEITEEEAATALAALPHLIRHRYPHTGRLSDLAWGHRHNITFYDGLYVALAAALDVPLLTADEKLTKSPGLPCRFELI